MIPAVHQDITQRLLRDYDFKERGRWLRAGVCPSCSKKELYTKAEAPWVLRCGRENNCAWQGHIKELYEDAFAKFNERFKPTDTNPNATADAYLMQARGFDITRIKGWYEQDRWWSPDAVGNSGTATVRFLIAPGIYFDRFVEDMWVLDNGEKKKRKAAFKGNFKGLAWCPPGQDIKQSDEVFITEGILDAIALILHGRKAIAILSCTNYPNQFFADYKSRGVRWVWALDGDKAGRKWTLKHHERARVEGFNSSAVTILQTGKYKQDWNDLHQTDRLQDRHMADYAYQGSLLIAQSAGDKALLMYEKTTRKDFNFEFKNRLYWFSLNLDKYQKAYNNIEEADNGMTENAMREEALKQSNTIVELANCYFRFLYFQANAITDESWYYARVTFPHGGVAVKSTFTGNQLSSPGEFKKRLLSIAAGSVFTGSSQQLDIIAKDQLYNIKTVNTIDFIGYSKEHGMYVFNDVAVKDGRDIALNDEDYFDADKLAIKSLSQSVHLSIAKDAQNYSTDWVNSIYTCFGDNGIAALAFWFGSLFAEQIREKQKSFPFLEIVGEPGSGKTTLIEFLWKLVGRRDYEGFDPSKSTLAARARNMAQVSNLPVVLIEGDRDDDAHGKHFDWDELKTAYNGRSVRSRGAKNGGNETYEPPFRGSIVISQNADVNASEAVLQRIVHLGFARGAHTDESRVLANALEHMPLEHVSHFMLTAARQEKAVMDLVTTMTPEFETRMLAHPEIKNVRIAKNHGQLCALVAALGLVLPISKKQIQSAQQNLLDLAKQRQKAISADHPLVIEFWEQYEFLNEGSHLSALNHSKDPGQIAVNLNHYVSVAADRRQQIPPMADLKRQLKSSRRHKYIGQKTVNSALLRGSNGDGKSVRCWLFENKEGVA
ncbi:MAG: toprim domain-containing protein [Candidatus Reddybacter sp.]